MNRTVAIVATTISTMFCGLLGLTITCLGSLMAINTQLPSRLTTRQAPETTIVIGVMIILLGLGILLIPVIVTFVSFRLLKDESQLPSDGSAMLLPKSEKADEVKSGS